jgi:hypothetical protein
MITRRNFISLSATSAAALSLAACQRPWDFAPGSKKKGLGQSVKTPDWAQRLAAVRSKWFYSWNHTLPAGVPKGTEFIPMIYRYGGNPQIITDTAVAAKKAGITELLGFNEPDKAKQGNMTLEETLAAWPLLMETGLRLGSPGCTHPDTEWMIQFMAAARERNLRVDFVCVHSYGGPNPQSFVQKLEKVHQMFGLPLWITEFAVGDWNAKSVEENKHKPETVLRYMEQVLPMLDKLDFVERYAWFPAKTTSIPLGTCALFDANGALTPLGECYRDA